jgi:hypothetical protein
MRLKKLHLNMGSFSLYIEELTLPLLPMIFAATTIMEVTKESLQHIA